MTNNHHSNPLNQRENFLMSLLSKVIKEYKALLKSARQAKPFKITEIIHASAIPGESKFAIQLANKNCIFQLTAAEIIREKYDLNMFTEFHAEIIRQAALGKLIPFLKLADKKQATYKIESKKIDHGIEQYIFTVVNNNGQQLIRTAEEIVNDEELLSNLDIKDIFDIAYTQGTESILKEKTSMLLARSLHSNDT